MPLLKLRQIITRHCFWAFVNFIWFRKQVTVIMSQIQMSLAKAESESNFATNWISLTYRLWRSNSWLIVEPVDCEKGWEALHRPSGRTHSIPDITIYTCSITLHGITNWWRRKALTQGLLSVTDLPGPLCRTAGNPAFQTLSDTHSGRRSDCPKPQKQRRWLNYNIGLYNSPTIQETHKHWLTWNQWTTCIIMQDSVSGW